MADKKLITVVLAAGKGTRMQTAEPKVMARLDARPLLLHVLANLKSAGCKRFIIVVGYQHEKVRALVTEEGGLENCEFVLQEEQLGTGHALLCTADVLLSSAPFQGPLMVTAGDMPLLSASSFQSLFACHQQNKNAVTVLSAILENPYGYGRLVKDSSGQLLEIVEEKDASVLQRKIREVNTGTYIFECPQVFSLLKQVDSQNAQREYYLPDLVSLARLAGHRVEALSLVDPLEACGVNSLAELEEIQRLLDLSAV